MVKSVFDILLDFLKSEKVDFTLLSHAACRSSVESAAARASAGVVDAVGAKALVLISDETSTASIMVLPGPKKLDNKILRKKIGRVRFANQQELSEATDGLEAGMVPPFGQPVFKGIRNLYVDDGIKAYSRIGFNAACLDRSIIVDTESYIRICRATDIFRFSSD